MQDAEDISDTPALRITFVSRKWPPAMGGIETYAYELSRELDGMADVRRIVLPGNADGSPPGAMRLLGFGIATAWRLVTMRRPGAVTHVADMASWPLALVARLRAPRSKIVLSAHGTDLSYAKNRDLKGRLYALYLGLGAWLMGGATVISNSRATAELARSLGFERTETVPLATTMRPPRPHPEPSRRLLFAGRIIPSKGLRWFVGEVLPQLADDVSLDVAGTVWDRDEAVALSAPRVRHIGTLGPDALARAYAGALAVVAPNLPVARSNFEGFGLVAAEAAAAGGVVVAADYFGLADAVEDGVTGTLLPPGDAKAWVAALCDIAAWSADDRAEHVARAQARAEALFSWRRVADQTCAAYRAD